MAARALLFVLLAGVVPAATADERSERLAEWFAGAWDSVRQAEDDRASGVDAIDRHPRLAIAVATVEAAAVSGQLFAWRVHETGGLAGPVTRVELHRFAPSPVTTEIVHERVYLKDPSAWGDLRASLASLAPLRDADLRGNRRCRVYWRWVDDHFEGRTREGRCEQALPEADVTRIERFFALYVDRFVQHERHFAPDGTPRVRAGGRTPQVYLRAQDPAGGGT